MTLGLALLLAPLLAPGVGRADEAAAPAARTSTAPADPGTAPLAPKDPHLIAVPPPPFSDGIFPCSDCHDGTDVDTRRRVLEEHTDIVLEHDAENRWCLDCHDAKNRDQLHKADGTPISFKESYKLCGQCHGPTLKAWQAGEHGKRTGSWSGKKSYLLCVHCHNPHSPRFKPLVPKSPPVRPGEVR